MPDREMRGRWRESDGAGAFITSRVTPPGPPPPLRSASTDWRDRVFSRNGYSGRIPFRVILQLSRDFTGLKPAHNAGFIKNNNKSNCNQLCYLTGVVSFYFEI